MYEQTPLYLFCWYISLYFFHLGCFKCLLSQTMLSEKQLCAGLLMQLDEFPLWGIDLEMKCVRTSSSFRNGQIVLQSDDTTCILWAIYLFHLFWSDGWKLLLIVVFTHIPKIMNKASLVKFSLLWHTGGLALATKRWQRCQQPCLVLARTCAIIGLHTTTHKGLKRVRVRSTPKVLHRGPRLASLPVMDNNSKQKPSDPYVQW